MIHLIRFQSIRGKWLWGINLFLCLIFLGFWTVTSFYTESILDVWGLGTTGQYFILNIVISGLAAITLLSPVYRKRGGKFLMFWLFLGLVVLDFFFLNEEEAPMLVVPFYLFLPLYLHLISLLLVEKFWKNPMSGEPLISR